MKLRIRGDSIRLRLRQPEVQQLLIENILCETTAFAPDMVLQVQINVGGEVVQGSFKNGLLRVAVPREQIIKWAGSEQVSIIGSQDAGEGRTLLILVEKDFACKDSGNGESQDDAFENPNKAAC